MMKGFIRNIAPVVVAAISLGQGSSQLVSHRPRIIWGPPHLQLPSTFPKPSVNNEIIAELKIAGWSVTLEKTELAQAQKHFEAVIGSRGDASEALGWVCLQGKDEQGLWALWLYSGEIDGPMIGGFQWQRISSDVQLDHRCKAISPAQRVELPIRLSLGMSEAKVVSNLGQPSGTYRNLAIYSHEHDLTIDNELYTVENDLFITYRNGRVDIVAANHTTSN